jgi:adenosylmethionine-8-amino-7-oxononanoate aminotransferase
MKSQTEKLVELDREHHLHGFTHFEPFKKDELMLLEEGEGCYLTDGNGQRYFDSVGGMWCTNIGLGREEMAEAIADQVRKMAYSHTFAETTNRPAGELAAKIAELAPGSLNHVFFSNGGSTAVDSAMRLVHFYQGSRGKGKKRHIISRKEAYHGSTYAAMSLGHRGDRVKEFQYLEDEIHHVSAPNLYRAPEGMNEAAFIDSLVEEFEAKVLEIGPERVGAFIAEPIQGSGGVIVPPKGYLERIHALCRKYDVLFIADEVVTAFGRVGHWFSSEDVFGIMPDIITSAKGLSSGYLPLGATIYSDEIHQTISEGDPDRYFAHAFTYSGHPVCCTAGLKNIEIIEREDLLTHVRRVGPYFERRLKELSDLPIVGEVRGMNLMMCVENVKDKQTKELLPREVAISKRIAATCDRMGLIVRPLDHLIVLSPPLVMTEEQVDFVVETLGKGIRSVADDLTRSGDL